ncbi:MAG: Polysaccharide biosynthesis protein [Paucimonas sp.]|nr:Polysaccharide biosynthesis protein [Paucimonas sp.]
MSIRRNIFFSYAGTAVAIAAPVIALPWYLSSLGPKQFGLIGFIASILAVLGVLDSGMSQALIREVAVRLDGTHDGKVRAASLLLVFERVYWVFSIAVGMVLCLLAPTIASRWLNLDGVDMDSGALAIYGAGFIFALQFPGAVYRSLLVASQAQAVLNKLIVGCAISRQVIGVVAVIVWPTLTTFLISQALCAGIETILRRQFAWREVKTPQLSLSWSASEALQIWRVTVGTTTATLLGALAIQTDRIVLSRMSGIEELGYYSIATTVAIGALQLINPLIQATLPKAIQLRDDARGLHRLSVTLAMAIGAVVLCGTLVYGLCGEWLLREWLRSEAAVAVVYPVLSVLLIGTAFNAFYNVGYVNWMAQKKIAAILWVNGVSLALCVALIPYLVQHFGLIGAACGWLTMNFIGLVCSLGWVGKRRCKE